MHANEIKEGLDEMIGEMIESQEQLIHATAMGLLEKLSIRGIQSFSEEMESNQDICFDYQAEEPFLTNYKEYFKSFFTTYLLKGAKDFSERFNGNA